LTLVVICIEGEVIINMAAKKKAMKKKAKKKM
jgi:hypothetical protein